MPELPPNSLLRQARHQVATRLDDVAVVLNTQTSHYYQLSPIGADIWEKLSQPTRLRQLLDELSHDYEAPSETIEREALDFIEQLLQNGLIEAKAAE